MVCPAFSPFPAISLPLPHFFVSSHLIHPLALSLPQSFGMIEADRQTSSDFADDPNVMAARSDAGVGIGSNCQIPRAGQKGSLGDIGESYL